jgi:hypothetical protein
MELGKEAFVDQVCGKHLASQGLLYDPDISQKCRIVQRRNGPASAIDAHEPPGALVAGLEKGTRLEARSSDLRLRQGRLQSFLKDVLVSQSLGRFSCFVNAF